MHRVRVPAILALLFAASASPHHNMTAIFDFNDRVELNGTFTKMDWRNPHVQLTVEIKNAEGKMETWTVEGPPPSFFRARDIGQNDFTLALNKLVMIEVSRARDHSQSGLLRILTLPDGRLVSACPQNC